MLFLNMARLRLILFASLACALPTSATSAQTTSILGTVLDTTGAPIAGASVAERVSGTSTWTDSLGRFRLPGLRHGLGRLIVRQVGYFAGEFSVILLADSTLEVAVHLTPGVIAMDSIVVRAPPGLATPADMAGFSERRRDRERGGGSSTFIGSEEVRRRSPRRVSDLLGSIAGVNLRYDKGIAIPYGRDGRCIMNIWVNGVLVDGLYPGQSAATPPSYFTRAGNTGNSPRSDIRETGGIDAFMNASEIEAVEVYPAPSETPARFDDLRNQCGTIVIWTK